MRDENRLIRQGGKPKAEAMGELLRELESSELSQQEFAREHGLSVAALHYWKRKLRRAAEPQWLEVKAVEAPERSGCRIELPGAVVIYLEGPLPVAELVELSRALS